MLRMEAQHRLFTIKITMGTAKAADSDVEAFLKAMPVDLRNPFDGSAFKWMPEKRAIVGVMPRADGFYGGAVMRGFCLSGDLCGAVGSAPHPNPSPDREGLSAYSDRLWSVANCDFEF